MNEATAVELIHDILCYVCPQQLVRRPTSIARLSENHTSTGVGRVGGRLIDADSVEPILASVCQCCVECRHDVLTVSVGVLTHGN